VSAVREGLRSAAHGADPRSRASDMLRSLLRALGTPFAIPLTGILSALNKHDAEWKVATYFGIYGDDIGPYLDESPRD
jgi:hypothetical protein